MQHYIIHINISLLPSNVRMRSPVCGFHSLILLSHDPEAIVLPSGEKATDLTILLWPDETYMPFVWIDEFHIHTCVIYDITMINSTSKKYVFTNSLQDSITPAVFNARAVEWIYYNDYFV